MDDALDSVSQFAAQGISVRPAVEGNRDLDRAAVRFMVRSDGSDLDGLHGFVTLCVNLG
jgi:hypothetical protein